MSQLTALSSPHSNNNLQALQSASVFAPQPSSRRISKIWLAAALSLVVVLAGSGIVASRIIGQPAASTHQVATPTSTPTPQATPQVASATFGDLISQANSFDDWFAGLNQGSIELTNPNNGQQFTVSQADSPWYGPISGLYWSPDKTKIAAIYLSDKDAQAFTANPTGHARSLGLDSSVSPSSFPFGYLAIIDIQSKQRHSTSFEVKNSPKSLVWLDNSQIAFINSSIHIYDTHSQESRQVLSAGNTTAQQQLASPLVWNKTNQHLYFTRTKQIDNQTAYLLSQVSLTDSTVEDVSQIQLEQLQSEVFQLFDMAVSPGGQRLAIINQQGLAYIDLTSKALHQLPYQDNLLWLKQVAISQLHWISDHRLTFSGIDLGGQRVWAGWDTEQQMVPAFAKGNHQGTWQASTGQLAVVNLQKSQAILLSPDWNDPSRTSQSVLDLKWSAVYW